MLTVICLSPSIIIYFCSSSKLVKIIVSSLFLSILICIAFIKDEHSYNSYGYFKSNRTLVLISELIASRLACPTPQIVKMSVYLRFSSRDNLGNFSQCRLHHPSQSASPQRIVIHTMIRLRFYAGCPCRVNPLLHLPKFGISTEHRWPKPR